MFFYQKYLLISIVVLKAAHDVKSVIDTWILSVKVK